MSMDQLAAALTEYSQALDCLPERVSGKVPEDAEGQPKNLEATKALAKAAVLRVLTARDRVAHLAGQTENLDRETLDRLFDLDDRLRKSAVAIEHLIGHTALPQWRESVQVPATSWWWHLDEQSAEDRARRGIMWIVPAAFFLAVSISLSTDITRRFLSDGFDTIGSFSTLMQGLITALAGRALISAQPSASSVLGHMGRFQWFQNNHSWKLIMATVVLAVVLALRASLPSIAQLYNSSGLRSEQQGNISSAMQDYKRAISLNPDFAQAHYNLADAYEEVLDYDSAQTEYKTAILADPKLYSSYNNLARLYMLRASDFAQALLLLNRSLDNAPGTAAGQQIPELIRYTLFKNRGWAYFGLGDYASAEEDLGQALKLRPDGSAAHCLLAQVQEKAGQTPTAEWEACLSYAAEDPVQPEPDWVSMAREHVNSEGTK
jgi:tetratricopeptide (TPR) repeat protein